jgi:C1A family cysteine protease
MSDHSYAPIFIVVFAIICSLGIGSIYYLSDIPTYDFATLSDVLADKKLMAKFNAFKLKNRKTYYTHEEQDMRLLIFASNYKKIQQFNDEGHSYTLDINFLADLTEEEYQQYYLNRPKPTGYTGLENYPTSSEVTEENIDYSNIVGKVKDQGTCGSCWTFGAIGALEYVYAKSNNNKYTEFSEQHLVDCCKGGEYTSEGCEGGEKVDAFKFSAVTGLVLEADYPYNAMDNPCQTNKNIVFKTSGSHFVPAADNDALLERLKIQAIDIGINAAPFTFRFYSKGVVNMGCTYTEIDHDVLLLGAGQYPIDNTPTWKIKNSWGRNWGADGYIYILRESGKKPAQCAMNLDAASPLYKDIQ